MRRHLPPHWIILFYFPPGGLFPLPPPEELPVVLGPFGGDVAISFLLFEMLNCIKCVRHLFDECVSFFTERRG